MNRLVHVGAVPLVLTAVIGVSGCGGTDTTPTKNSTTVTKTVNELPTPEPTASAPESTTPALPSTVTDASSVVRAYVAAINAQDYRRAWDLGGKNLSDSYSAFADGFATTAHDALFILHADSNTVLVRLEAAQTDGSLKIFEGTYMVRAGTIVGADIHEVTGPEPHASEDSPYYANCDEARAAGAAPIYEGEPGYAPHLDRDGDGVACEPYPP